MRHALITVVLAAAVAAWLPKQAPVKPDFSGTWKLDPAASVVAPAARRVGRRQPGSARADRRQTERPDALADAEAR